MKVLHGINRLALSRRLVMIDMISRWKKDMVWR